MTAYRFGQFDFLPDERRLKKAGKEISLGARAFDLLAFLVSNRHRVVTKAEMLDAVWPDIAVEESNLTVQVSALRKALGADALATIPGRGYQFVLVESAVEEPPAAKAKPQAGTGHSILVLPFANTSNDPDQEYFSDGIAEDIITDLSKISALSVVARNTAFTFKGQAVDVSEISERLGVSHVVEGSVRKAGNRLRINAQLVDGATGHPVWADRFDRDLTDIFALQDEITQAIVAALKVRLVPDERAAIHARSTDNPRAYEIYLQARYHHLRTDRKNYQIAERLARQALSIDPSFDRAWSLLATSQAGLYGLDPTSDNGLAAAERALELNPGLADAMAAKARVLAGMGRFDEALPLHQRSFELDPDSYDVLFLYGRTLFQLGRHEDAITYWERATELFPDAIPAVTSVEMCYTATGQTEKAKGAVLRAIERLERALARDANDTYALMYKALGHAHMGEVDAAKMLALRLKAMEPEDPSIDYNIGCALAIMGEIEDALDLLERGLARANPSAFAQWIERDTDLDPLRDQPRFKKIRAELQSRAAAAAQQI